MAMNAVTQNGVSFVWMSEVEVAEKVTQFGISSPCIINQFFHVT